MSRELLVAVVGIIAAGVGYVVKAMFERKSLRANAESSEASATAVVVAAARELVDPLRAELKAVRAEHARETEDERTKLAVVRRELQAAMDDSHALRRELEELRDEMHRMQEENAAYRRQVAALERELAEARGPRNGTS